MVESTIIELLSMIFMSWILNLTNGENLKQMEPHQSLGVVMLQVY